MIDRHIVACPQKRGFNTTTGDASCVACAVERDLFFVAFRFVCFSSRRTRCLLCDARVRDVILTSPSSPCDSLCSVQSARRRSLSAVIRLRLCLYSAAVPRLRRRKYSNYRSGIARGQHRMTSHQSDQPGVTARQRILNRLKCPRIYFTGNITLHRMHRSNNNEYFTFHEF